MNFLGFHICQDELYALLMCIPFAGFVVNWIKSRAAIWRRRHTDHCTHADKEHHYRGRS